MFDTNFELPHTIYLFVTFQEQESNSCWYILYTTVLWYILQRMPLPLEVFTIIQLMKKGLEENFSETSFSLGLGTRDDTRVV